MTRSGLVGRLTVHLAVAVLVLVSVLPVTLGRFYYKDFRDVRFVRLGGSARPHLDSQPPCVALTYNDHDHAQENQAGAMWYERTVDMREKKRRRTNQGPDGFVTSFNFRVTPYGGLVNRTAHLQQVKRATAAAAAKAALATSTDATPPLPPTEVVLETDDPKTIDTLAPGGDGFAFLFRSVPPGGSGDVVPELGRVGSGLGYADLSGFGIAVEFDTRMDLEERDPNANHVSVHIRAPSDKGDGFSTFEANDARVVPLSFAKMPLRRPRVISSRRKRIMVSSKPLLVQISYVPSKRLLKVFVEDPVSPILVLTDAPAFSGTFQLGFTGTTSGQSMDTHEICQWYFEKREALDGTATAAATDGPAKGVPAPPPKSKRELEKCDPGFTGESCMLDLASLAETCLFATSAGCGGCLSHPSGHCQWCASQARCISNELATRSFDLTQHKPYCSDPASIVEEASECAEEPRYVLWGALIVLFIIVVCVVIAATGALWLKSKINDTLLEDVATLIFYTILGSGCSIFVTSVVNMVLTEITANADGSVFSLGVFLLLFAALLGRDVHLFRSGSPRGGGLHGTGGPNSPINYSTLQNPDDAEASQAVMNSFERQQRFAASSPITSRSSSDRLAGGATSPTSNGNVSHRLFKSLTTVRGMMFVPTLFACISCIAVLLCFFVLERDWTFKHGPHTKLFIYTTLAMSLLFTLAYLFVTVWRLGKLIAFVVLEQFCGRFCPGLVRRWSHTSGETDVCELVSQFANTSLVKSVAQVRIMAVCAAISGIYFGHMFGALDNEDTTRSHLDLMVQRENYYSYPLTAFLGAMSSFTNQVLDLHRAMTQETIYVDEDEHTGDAADDLLK